MGLIAGKELSPVEVTEAYLERIDDINPKLNAYITVCAEEAMQAAQEAEQAVVNGDSLGPLHGLPLAVKDQFETKGILTTAGSRILADYVPDHDATAIARASRRRSNPHRQAQHDAVRRRRWRPLPLWRST